MDLSEIRTEITGIDENLVDLIVRRMKLVLEVARYKKENNLPVLDRTRERALLSHITDIGEEGFEEYLKTLFSVMFDMSRSYQIRVLTEEGELARQIEKALEKTPKIFPAKAVVACQGVEGAYSQQACDRLFSLPNIVYCRHFDGVFQAVQSGFCQYGILPIENSSFGSVRAVYDLMRDYQFHIVRSTRLCLSHALLAREGCKISDVKEIFSHEHAIGQCSEFLRANNIKISVCENTAVAAKIVAESDRRDIAAISSVNCAELYGLKVLSEKIQNNDNNYTRFICISRDLEIYPGANKISLVLNLPHKPGTLYSTIARFAAAGLNLTKLESRPIPGKDFEFTFYLDMDANIYSKELVQLLSKFEQGAEPFSFLGAYSEI